MKVLITGGGGFLGRHIVERLLDEGHEVAVMNRRDYPDLRALGVEVIQGDITRAEDARAAVEGRDAVIHTAAMVGTWGRDEDFERINVGGTREMLVASRDAGVTRFVLTSSPSAVFDGVDMVNAPQDYPYPASFPNAYGRTKAESERLALSFNDPAGLRVVALRPQLMWGAGDPHLLPLLTEKTRRGALKVVGDGKCMVDLTYIDNAAQTHLDALTAVDKDADDPTFPGGKAYFISNDEPVELWTWIGRMLDQAGEPGPKGKVPKAVAWAAAWVVESAWRALGLTSEPPLLTYVVLKMSTHQWYDMGPARRDLGYNPTVSMEEGLRRVGEAIKREERSR